MRLAVAGGTGCVGRLVVEAARAAGHEAVAISRATGTDLVSGAGLAGALRGVDAVIDVSNVVTFSQAKSVAFFAPATASLLAAEVTAGVGHHVALSIVGIDRVPYGYYAGKQRQEELIADGKVPWTVLRATQFHEFPAQLLARMSGPLVLAPKMPAATVAAREVAGHLVELAAGPALGRAPEMAGPEVREMADLVRRMARVLGRRSPVVPVRLPGRAGAAMAGGGLLPAGAGPRGRQTFGEWLAEYAGAR